MGKREYALQVAGEERRTWSEKCDKRIVFASCVHRCMSYRRGAGITPESQWRNVTRKSAAIQLPIICHEGDPYESKGRMKRESFQHGSTEWARHQRIAWFREDPLGLDQPRRIPQDFERSGARKETRKQPQHEISLQGYFGGSSAETSPAPGYQMKTPRPERGVFIGSAIGSRPRSGVALERRRFPMHKAGHVDRLPSSRPSVSAARVSTPHSARARFAAYRVNSAKATNRFATA